MTEKFMSKTILDGGYYAIRLFYQGAKLYHVVKNKEGLYNFADSKGRIMCEKDFSNYKVHEGMLFVNGFATITQTDGTLNFVKEDGELLVKDESIKIKSAGAFSSDNIVNVQLINDKSNFLTTEGKLVIGENREYDNLLSFKNGYGIVSKGKKVNYIDTSANIISKVWFVDAHLFNQYGLAKCCVADKGWNVINKRGNLILDEYYEYITIFDNIILARDMEFVKLYRGDGSLLGQAFIENYVIEFDRKNDCVFLRNVYVENKINVFLSSGKRVFEDWYEEIRPIRITITTSELDNELFFLVKKKNSKGRMVSTIMDKNGKYAFTRKWFQQFDGEFKDPKEYTDHVTVLYNSKWYYLNFWEKNSLTPIKWYWHGKNGYPYECIEEN